MKNKKGFSLVELSIGTAIGLVLVIAAMLILVWMTNMQRYFKNRTSNDMSWITATEHIKKHIHSASYVEIPDQATLQLRDYNGNLTGTYTNTANGLNFDTDNMTFENVAATFERIYPAAPKPKITEVRVNYTAPAQIASSIVIKCGVDSSSTWAEMASFYSNYGISSYEIGSGPSIRRTPSNGGYIIAATLKNASSNSCAYILKISENGGIVWSRLVSTGSYTRGADACEASDGGYVALCGRVGDMRLVKFDASGVITGNKSLGAVYPVSMSPTDDGGYIVVGQNSQVTTSPFTGYCLVVKVDSNFNILSSRQVDSKFCSSPSTDNLHVQIWPNQIIETFDKKNGGASTGYALVGTLVSPKQNITIPWLDGTVTYDAGSKRVGFFVKLDPNLTTEQQFQTYFTPAVPTPNVRTIVPTEYGSSLTQTFDQSTGAANGYLLAGYSGEVSGNPFIRKIDVNGAQTWVRSARDRLSMITSIVPVSDGYVIGDTSMNSTNTAWVWEGSILKLDSNFNVTLDNKFSGGTLACTTGSASSLSTRYKVVPTTDGGYLMLGSEINSAKAEGLTGYNERLCIIKTDADGKCAEITSPQKITETPPMSSI